MSYIGNTPGVSSQRVVLEEVVSGSAKSNFTPISGYTLGYVDVLLNGVEVDSADFTATDGVTVTLTNAAQVGDTVKIKTWLPRGLSDGYLKSEADAKYLKIDGSSVATFLAIGGARVGSGPLSVAATSGEYARFSGKNSSQVSSDLTISRTSSSTSIVQGPNLYFDDGTTNNTRAIQSGSGNLQFWAYRNGWIEEMRIDTSGNVGIGTTAPQINSGGKTVHLHAAGTNQWSLLHTTNGETTGAAGRGTIFGQIGYDAYLFNYEAGNMILATNSAERARIDSSGNFSLATGNLILAAGKGIDFSATGNGSGSMQSELLDDFERGTWTCSSGSSGFTCTGTGYYVKIGRLVWASIYFQATYTGTSYSNVAVMGLPYVSDGYHSVSNGYLANSPAIGQRGGYTESGNAYFLYSGVQNSAVNLGYMVTVVYQATS